MKKLLIFCLALGFVFAISGTAAFGGGGPMHGVLENNTLLAYASTSGAGGNSGRIWSAEGTVEGLGRVEVLVSASWNWSFYNSDHPSALVNTRQVDFYGCRTVNACADGEDLSSTADLTQGVVPGPLTNDYANGKVRRGHPDGFGTDATVRITARNGDVLVGLIDDGSVTEIQAPSPSGGGSVNEWFIGFKIHGTLSTGRFTGAEGRGFINMIFDSGGSGTVYSDTTGVYQDDPARFLKHEIFLDFN